MGSKRSKTSNKVPSSPTPAAPQPDENHQNPKNPNLAASPSKPRKKPKHITSMPPDKNSPSLIPCTEGEVTSKSRKHKGKVPDSSNEISLSDGNPTRSASIRWGESDNLKFLKAIDAFRAKNGFLPSPSHMKDLLREIKDWAPSLLVEKNLHSKIRHLRYKFHKSPIPGPDSSEFDRSFYKLGSLLWGPLSSKTKGSATGTLNEDTLKENDMVERKDNGKVKKENASKKLNREKKDMDVDKEIENGVKEDDRDSEDDEDSDEKAEKDMEVENGDEHEKDELLVGEDNGLLDGDAAEFPYKYLKLALEEYWMEAKLNMDTLYSALPKVDPVQAKRLDEQFLEVFEEMLKLKIEKNKVSNEIIQASLSR